MVDKAVGGYGGACSALMLSASEELSRSQQKHQKFEWSRVSDSDPRILSSEWLKLKRGGYYLYRIRPYHHLLPDNIDPVDNDSATCPSTPESRYGVFSANPERTIRGPATGKRS
jgi:hypothetical protein